MSYVADALLVLGLAVTTLGVVGVWRMPDLLTGAHASSLIASGGVAGPLAATAIVVGGAAWVRAALVLVLLALTVPVAAHVVAQAARRRARDDEDGERDPAKR